MIMRVFNRSLMGTLILIALFWAGCKKEITMQNPAEKLTKGITLPEANFSKEKLTISNAKKIYEQQVNQVASRSDTLEYGSSLIILSQSMPLWDFANYWLYMGDSSIIVVPITQCSDIDNKKQSHIVFFNNKETGQIESRFLFLQAEDGFEMTEANIANFSGNIIQLDWEGKIVDSYSFEDGQISGFVHSKDESSPRTEFACWDVLYEFLVLYDNSGCYTYSVFVEGVWCVNTSSGGGSYTYGDDPFGWGNNESPSGGNSSNGGGGDAWSPNNISNFFNLSDLLGTDMLNAQLINQFKNKYCLFTPSSELLSNIQNSCGLPTDSEDLYIELKQLFSAGPTTMNPCVKDLIIQDRITFLESKGIPITSEQLLTLFDLNTLLSCEGGEVVSDYFSNFWYAPPPPSNPPITDVKANLDACFGTSCSNCTYSVTLYIEQPKPGTRDIFAWNSSGSSTSGSLKYNGGHTFMGLNQTDEDGEVTSKMVGFYPHDYPNGGENVSGNLYNEDANSRFNISVRYSLTEAQFTKLRENLEGASYTFNALSQNCSTFAVRLINSAAGLDIPEKKHYQFPIGTFDANPADLGEDLRADSHGGIFNSLPTHYFIIPSNFCQ